MQDWTGSQTRSLTGGGDALPRIRQVRTRVAEFLHTLESDQGVVGDPELDSMAPVRERDDDWRNG